jgi:GNAT superfamily N-acetyltransferase
VVGLLRLLRDRGSRERHRCHLAADPRRGEPDRRGDRADGASALGFATYVVHPYTWSEQPICYLEDLFVRRDARGGGIGRALIEHVIDLGRAEGWARVYWMTRADNEEARVLYDRFCPADGFVRYTVSLTIHP